MEKLVKRETLIFELYDVCTAQVTLISGSTLLTNLTFKWLPIQDNIWMFHVGQHSNFSPWFFSLLIWHLQKEDNDFWGQEYKNNKSVINTTTHLGDVNFLNNILLAIFFSFDKNCFPKGSFSNFLHFNILIHSYLLKASLFKH